MGSDERAEIAFPVSADGRRSTSAAGQAVVAGALARSTRRGRSRPGTKRTGGPGIRRTCAG